MDAENSANTAVNARSRIIGVRFQKVGKIYHFDSGTSSDVEPGDYVVVETSRGRQLGQVVHFVTPPPSAQEGSWKPILRKASAPDMVLRQVWQQKELEAIINCRAKASEQGFGEVKFVAAEFSFDGARLSILYSHESEEKLEFKSLRRTMARMYPQSQIEFHMIGPRDVAKILGGMGACGLETRCCSIFLTEFSPISIKMAKEQGISLTPTEITGMCGRLRCCLVFEYEQYVTARKQLPKRGKRVGTPKGEGRVIDVMVLKEAVLVEFDSGGTAEFMKHELQPLEELEALRQKAEAGCDKHPDGNCDCGKKVKKEGKYERGSKRPSS